MMEPFDSVTLTRDLPEVGLKAGARGAITDVHEKEHGYMVEFFDAAGDTIAIEFVDHDALRLTTLEERQAKHMRGVAAE